VPYGTQQQVATMASTWTDDGVWGEYSNPTLLEVEGWLGDISAQFDLALGAHFFVFPIDPARSPTAYKAVSQYVVNLVADLCNFKNSSGRFFTEKLVELGMTPWAAILKDINKWIELNANGLVADNVPQIERPSIRNQPLFRVMSKP